MEFGVLKLRIPKMYCLSVAFVFLLLLLLLLLFYYYSFWEKWLPRYKRPPRGQLLFTTMRVNV